MSLAKKGGGAWNGTYVYWGYVPSIWKPRHTQTACFDARMEHQRAQVGTLVVFGRGGNVGEHKNTPHMGRFSCLPGGRWRVKGGRGWGNGLGERVGVSMYINVITGKKRTFVGMGMTACPHPCCCHTLAFSSPPNLPFVSLMMLTICYAWNKTHKWLEWGHEQLEMLWGCEDVFSESSTKELESGGSAGASKASGASGGSEGGLFEA